MAGSARKGTQPNRPRGQLRLVKDGAVEVPPILTDPATKREFEQLTQRLVDVAIEIVDLIDGDPDLEPDEQAEDDDGV
jgi:hypothetical protein